MILLTILLCVLWCSICEWLLHKYMMHNALFGFQYPYEAHAKIHHTTFKADDTYQLQNEEDKNTIPMAWWNSFAIALMASVPLIILGWKYFFMNYIVAMCYYGVYETLHWCMHLPKRRKVEYSTWYRKLNGHHILHHRYTNRNYNVVLPFADLIFGTLLTKSPIKFNQVKPSYCVPDVQP